MYREGGLYRKAKAGCNMTTMSPLGEAHSRLGLQREPTSLLGTRRGGVAA